MMYFKSEGVLFRRADNQSPFEIYMNGKWSNYTYMSDNLFISSIELSKADAAKLKKQLDAKESEHQV